MTTIMNWQIYACSTHSHGHTAPTTTSNVIFGRTNYVGDLSNMAGKKSKNKKEIPHNERTSHSIREFICGTIVWQLRYGICEMVCSLLCEKDTNANTHTHASHDKHKRPRLVWNCNHPHTYALINRLYAITTHGNILWFLLNTRCTWE